MNKKLNLLIIIAILPFLGLSCGTKKPTNGGVYKSSDNGETWEQKAKIDEKNDITQVSVNEIEVDKKDNNIILIGTEGFGVYRSTDGGDVWSPTVLNFGNIYSIDISPDDNSIVYAAGSYNTVGKIYKSMDAGNNWEEVFSEVDNDTPVYSMEIDWYDSRIIYAATTSGALIKSKDSGRSWVAIKKFDDPVNKVAIGTQDSRILYLFTKKELYRSTDAGKTFVDLSNSFKNYNFREFHDMVVHPKFSNIIYISSTFGLLRSSDGGKKWEELNLLSKPAERIYSRIALDQINPNIIYFGFGPNLYLSEDNGINWSVKQFTTGNITSINAQASQDSTLYAGINISK